MDLPDKVKNLESPIAARSGGAADAVFKISYASLSIAILASYASLFRPLWIDEAIHLALSGQPTLIDLLTRLHHPDASFLTKQTGFYQILNYLTLSMTGANFFALRLPSLLLGGLLIWGTYTFLRGQRASRAFQMVGLIAVAGQGTLMYFVGEARPYLPLAATTVGMLAFFMSSSQDQRKTSIRWLGLLSLFLGALFHPYFIFLMPVMLAFSLWYRWLTRDISLGWRNLIRSSHLIATCGSMVLALILGSVTWMRPQQTNQLDPFEWVGGSASSFANLLVSTHLEFLDASAIRSEYLLFALIVLVMLALSRRYRTHPRFFASFVLFFVAMATSLAIAGSSMLNNYAIGSRQLVAGIALVPLALVWQASLVSSFAKRFTLSRRDLLTGVIWGGFAALGQIALVNVVPSVPVTLVMAIDVFGAAFLALKAGELPASRARLFAVALITAGFVTASSIAGQSWAPPTTLAILSLLTLVAAIVVISGLRDRREGELSLGDLVAAVVVIFAIVLAVGQAVERTSTVREQIQSLEALREAANADPLGTGVMPERLDWKAIGQAHGQYGEGWVYAANINCLRGGPVWLAFGTL